MAREGSNNGNWKGGISLFKSADELLTLSPTARREILRRLMKSWVLSEGTGCWEWTGDTFACNGRARLTLGRRNHTAARLMYVLIKGATKGLCVLHECDNVICVRPAHLYLGSNADNSSDMVRKGRSAKGDDNGSRKYPERLIRGDDHPLRKDPTRVQCERNGRALLTNEQVMEIRRRYEPYVNNHKPSNQRELAAEFGVAQHVIAGIVKGLTWRAIL